MRDVIIALAVALLAAVAVAFTSNDFYLRILFSICVYFLCATGMNVLLGYAGQKSLGQAGLFAAGAYSAALLTTSLDLDPWLALILATIISAFCGVLIAAPSLRVRGPSLAMVTLAFGIVVEKLVTETTDIFGGAMGIYSIKPLTFAGEPLTMAGWVWLAIGLSLIVHLLTGNLLVGRFGRAFRSIQADEIAASAVGVKVLRYKILAFVIAATTCGLAGALVAQQNQYINSDFINFNLSVFILLTVLFGGSGTLAGPLLGAVILTLLSSFLARWTWLEHFVNGALLLFALYAMPRGVAGVLSDVMARFGSRTRAKRTSQVPAHPGLLPRRPDDALDAPLLAAEAVSKSYGGVKPARDIGMSLTAGHIHALIGPNGAGKSTFINMLTGIVRPDEGTIRFRDLDLRRLPAHAICAAGVGRTFQNLRLFRDLTVLENVMLGSHSRMSSGFWQSLLGLARGEEAAARRRALDILAFVGLSQVENAKAGSLAYGLQRRAELARALATEPHLLLLDEPAAGLNPQETEELGTLLLRIRDAGVTILLVEHHMDLVMRISDHIVVLDYGEKIAEGTPAAIQRDPRVAAAYLGSEDDEAATLARPVEAVAR